MKQEDTVLARVAALKATPTTKLKEQWQALFDTPPPRYNRRFLESRLAYRIQELAYGGLKPETVRRLEAAWSSSSTAATSPYGAAAPTTGRSPAHGSCASTRASSTT